MNFSTILSWNWRGVRLQSTYWNVPFFLYRLLPNLSHFFKKENFDSLKRKFWQFENINFDSLEKKTMKFVTNNRKTLQIPCISKKNFKPDPTKKMPQIRHQTVLFIKKVSFEIEYLSSCWTRNETHNQ
jgi:hypothetical protein